MHHTRRRKKRPSYGVRTVEIIRSRTGYGFTISGQAPCMLSCIVNASPAERAGLKPGDYLIAVNGQNVSKAPHDDVVHLIGNSCNLLKLQIAENYYSDSSDDELVSNNVLKSKHALRVRTKNATGHTSLGNHQPLYRAEKVIQDLHSGLLFQNQNVKGNRLSETNKPETPFRKTPVFGNTFAQKENQSRRNKEAISVHDFSSFDSKYNFAKRTITTSACSSPVKQLGGKENLSSKCEQNELSNFLYPSLQHLQNNWTAILKNAVFKAVVGYLGTIEMPKETQQCCSRLQAISSCIRRLRVEKKVHTLVLLVVYNEKISLINPHGNVIATYPSEKIISSGIYANDKKFFGLVTSHDHLGDCENEIKRINSSCHVFMIDPKIALHDTHVNVARMFSIRCNSLERNSLPCPDFFDSAEPVLHAINHLYQDNMTEYSPVLPGLVKVSLPEVHNHNLSSNSSNSDSGIAFHDDNYNSDQVFVVNVNVNDEKIVDKHVKCDDVFETSKSKASECSVPQNDRLNVRAMTKSGKGSSKETSFAKQEQRSENVFDVALNPVMTKPPVCGGKTGNEMALRGSLIPQASVEMTSKDNMTSVKMYVQNSKVRNDETVAKNPFVTHHPKMSYVTEDRTKLLDEIRVHSPLHNESMCNNSSMPYEKPASPKLHLRVSEGDSILEKTVMEPQIIGRVTRWAISFEKLLEDVAGIHTFSEFLRTQFCHENITFWVACEKFRMFSGPTDIKSNAREIYEQHLCNGAAEPVNVDSTAKQYVEDNLENPSKNLFIPAQKQIYSLMKFDCYSRFLKSPLFKECLMKEIASEVLPFEGDDSLNPNLPYFVDAKDVFKNPKDCEKEGEEVRRKSLLPWNRSKSSKEKENKKRFFLKTSELRKSFCRKDKKKQAETSVTAEATHSKSLAASDLKSFPVSKRMSTSLHNQTNQILCRVLLPDKSTTVVQTKQGISIYSLISSLLEKREMKYNLIDAFLGNSDKCLDLSSDSNILHCQEVRVEQRTLIQLELPNDKTLAIKAKPDKTLMDVLVPVLQHYGFKLEQYHDEKNMNTAHQINLADCVSLYDNHTLIIKPGRDNNDDTAANKLYINCLTTHLQLLNNVEMVKQITSSVLRNLFKENARLKFNKYGVMDISQTLSQVDTKSTGHSSRIMNLVRRNSIHFVPDVSQNSQASKPKSRVSVHETANISMVAKKNSQKLQLRSSDYEASVRGLASGNIMEDERRVELNCDYLTF